MKSMYDTSTCVNCSKKIEKGVEIEKNGDGKWVHSVCPNNGSGLPKKQNAIDVESIEAQQALKDMEVGEPTEDPYKHCILGCVRAAEFFKSIDYPKEMWNLSTIWNCERIKKK